GRGSTSGWPASWAWTGSSAGGPRRRRWPATWCTRSPPGAAMTDPRLGLTVTHRRYVPYSHAHYAGNLVDGAYALGLFGDVATEVCIRTDGDEGDRKSTRLNSSHVKISYAVFCLKKKSKKESI